MSNRAPRIAPHDPRRIGHSMLIEAFVPDVENRARKGTRGVCECGRWRGESPRAMTAGGTPAVVAGHARHIVREEGEPIPYQLSRAARDALVERVWQDGARQVLGMTAQPQTRTALLRSDLVELDGDGAAVLTAEGRRVRGLLLRAALRGW